MKHTQDVLICRLVDHIKKTSGFWLRITLSWLGILGGFNIPVDTNAITLRAPLISLEIYRYCKPQEAALCWYSDKLFSVPGYI